MTAATTLVWEKAGRPKPFGSKADLLKPIPGVCAVTGEHLEVTADINRALGDNFTDRSMFAAPHSDRVGEATLWACSGKGMNTLRLWSIVCAPGVPASQEKAFLSRPGLWLGNAANPRPIVKALTDPPDGEWLVSIALSGQKHVLPYATVNVGRGRWVVRMENTNVSSTPGEFSIIHEAAVALRRMGLRDEDILAGTPGQIKTREALEKWRPISESLTSYTQSPVLRLALWTITKGTLND